MDLDFYQREEFDSHYHGVYLRHSSGNIVMVSRSDYHTADNRLVHGEMLSKGRWQPAIFYSKELSSFSIEPGWYQANSTALYFSRAPVRNYRRGVCPANSRVYAPIIYNGTLRLNQVAGWGDFFIGVTLDKRPTPQSIKRRVAEPKNTEGISFAINRKIAVTFDDKVPVILFGGYLVGYFTSENEVCVIERFAESRQEIAKSLEVNVRVTHAS